MEYYCEKCKKLLPMITIYGINFIKHRFSIDLIESLYGGSTSNFNELLHLELCEDCCKKLKEIILNWNNKSD